MNKAEAKTLVGEIVGVLQESAVPKEVWPTAFSHLWVDMKSGGQTSASAAAESPTPTPGSPFADLARRTGVDSDHLQDMYALENGLLEVRVPARLLPSGKSAATVELALLVCAGREASGQQETSSDTIRAVCSAYNRFDSANFASTMKAGDANWQISGKGQKRAYKLRVPGWDQAGDVLRRLTGQA